MGQAEQPGLHHGAEGSTMVSRELSRALLVDAAGIRPHRGLRRTMTAASPRKGAAGARRHDASTVVGGLRLITASRYGGTTACQESDLCALCLLLHPHRPASTEVPSATARQAQTAPGGAPPEESGLFRGVRAVRE